MPLKKVVVAGPRGFCAGVVRAVDIVRIALKMADEPVYVRKEIVHNRTVVDELEALGAVFVEELDEVPDGALCIFSAHGVSPDVRLEAKRKNLRIIDATCPLVAKVHLEARQFARNGYSILLIGHEQHDEVIGTIGEAPHHIQLVSDVEAVDQLDVPDPAKVVFLTQTTLSVDDTAEIVSALRRRYPQLVGPSSDDICYATQNRQAAVKELARQVDLVLVIGAENSSNSTRLREVAEAQGIPAFLIADESQIQLEWLENVERIGVTAGASAPESLVRKVVEFLKGLGAAETEEVEFLAENVTFSLPQQVKEFQEFQGAVAAK